MPHGTTHTLSLSLFAKSCGLFFPSFHISSKKLKSPSLPPLFKPTHILNFSYSHPHFNTLFFSPFLSVSLTFQRMAPSSKLSLILVYVLAIWAVDLSEGASHHAPAPSVDCSSLVLTMADCLSFVTNGSTTTKPEGNCCSGLKSVLKSAPQCLCEAFKSSAQFGVVLNVTKATTLPAACKVSAPSASNCGLTETPTAAPVGALSPQSSPASPTSGAAAVPAMSGPATANEVSPAPAPAAGSTASSLFPISAGSLLLCLLAAIFSGF